MLHRKEQRPSSLQVNLPQTVFLFEFIYPAGGVNQPTLVASIKRMTFGADFHADIGFGGTYFKFIATGTSGTGFSILGMYLLFHGFTSLRVRKLVITATIAAVTIITILKTKHKRQVRPLPYSPVEG